MPAASPRVNSLTRQLTRTVPPDGRSSTPNIIGKGTNTGSTSRVTFRRCTIVTPDSMKPWTERRSVPSTVPFRIAASGLLCSGRVTGVSSSGSSDRLLYPPPGGTRQGGPASPRKRFAMLIERCIRRPLTRAARPRRAIFIRAFCSPADVLRSMRARNRALPRHGRIAAGALPRSAQQPSCGGQTPQQRGLIDSGHFRMFERSVAQQVTAAGSRRNRGGSRIQDNSGLP